MLAFHIILLSGVAQTKRRGPRGFLPGGQWGVCDPPTLVPLIITSYMNLLHELIQPTNTQRQKEVGPQPLFVFFQTRSHCSEHRQKGALGGANPRQEGALGGANPRVYVSYVPVTSSLYIAKWYTMHARQKLAASLFSLSCLVSRLSYIALVPSMVFSYESKSGSSKG